MKKPQKPSPSSIGQLLIDAFNALDKAERKELTSALGDVYESVVKFEAAQKLTPTDKRSAAWSVISNMTPRQYWALLPYLPDPTNPKGRGKGKGPVVGDQTLISEMNKRVKNGMKPTTAAKQILTERGKKKDGLTAAADHLVKVWKRAKYGLFENALQPHLPILNKSYRNHLMGFDDGNEEAPPPAGGIGEDRRHCLRLVRQAASWSGTEKRADWDSHGCLGGRRNRQIHREANCGPRQSAHRPKGRAWARP